MRDAPQNAAKDERGHPSVLRVANCSGFFGDRLSAAREMVEGGPIDVLTGDWLAELTMYILHKTRERSGGLRPDLPAATRRRPSDLHRAGNHYRVQCRWPQSRRSRQRPCESWPDARASRCEWLPSRGTTSPAVCRTLAAAGARRSSTSTRASRFRPDAPLVTANAYLGARPDRRRAGSWARRSW